MADLAAGQVLTAATFNMKVRKCIARAARTTASTAASAATGVLRLDDKPILAGHTYRITWKAQLAGTVLGDVLRGEIKYTTDASTPTTTSTGLPGSYADIVNAVGSSTVGHGLTITTDYTPVTDETLSVLLITERISGTGNVNMQATGGLIVTQMYIDDMGDDPGNTGTDI
jgi:hypothetical protein